MSDCSSDVCSSDLPVDVAIAAGGPEKPPCETPEQCWHGAGTSRPPNRNVTRDIRRHRAPPRGRTKAAFPRPLGECGRSEEHTSETPSLMRISYAVFCLKKKNNIYIYSYPNI